jgi:5-methylcytosine-specific restriction endonuclease McrA
MQMIGRPKGNRKCEVLGCDRAHYGLGFCKKHLKQHKFKTDPNFRSKAIARFKKSALRKRNSPEVLQAKALAKAKRLELVLENRRKAREATRLRYKTDQEFRAKQLQKASEWAKRNTGKALAKKAKRRAKLKQAMPKWLNQNHLKIIKEVFETAQILKGEGGHVYHVDHIIPLQNEMVCGLHVPWNLQLLPAVENIRKNNKLDEAA